MLDARWKDLQREAHPDRFAAQGPAAQRVAMQWSVRINEAYQRLRDPLKRAAYLCELHGAPIRAEDNTAMPAAFLMQQMQWREALDEATGAAELDALEDETQAEAAAAPPRGRAAGTTSTSARITRAPRARSDPSCSLRDLHGTSICAVSNWDNRASPD